MSELELLRQIVVDLQQRIQVLEAKMAQKEAGTPPNRPYFAPGCPFPVYPSLPYISPTIEPFSPPWEVTCKTN